MPFDFFDINFCSKQFQIKGIKVKIKLAAVGLASLVATSAFAQSSNFEGPLVGGLVSSVGSSTNINASGSTLSFGDQSMVPAVEIGYNYAATDKIVLGATATYDLTKTNGGALQLEGSGGNLESKNHYSLNFKPGYVINDSTLIYATGGYNSRVGTLTNTPLGNVSFSGFGYGVGAFLLLDKNIYLRLEVQRVEYATQSISLSGDLNVKPSNTVGTLGLGYKF